MAKKDEQLIIDLTRKIAYSYFEENRLDILFAAMASDIVWVGPAKHTRAEGREKVQAYLKETASSMFMCALYNEFTLIKPLGNDHYLVEANYDVEAKDTELYTARECLRHTLVFRRIKDDWQIVHLHASVAWSKLAEKEMFAKQAAIKTRRSFQKQPPDNAREQMIVNLLKHGLSNREIADHMGIAEITVKKALSRLYRRYGVTNRTGLITYFETDET